MHHHQYVTHQISPEVAEELGTASRLMAPVLRGGRDLLRMPDQERRFSYALSDMSRIYAYKKSHIVVLPHYTDPKFLTKAAERCAMIFSA